MQKTNVVVLVLRRRPREFVWLTAPWLPTFENENSLPDVAFVYQVPNSIA
jgi:hypothetical protein